MGEGEGGGGAGRIFIKCPPLLPPNTGGNTARTIPVRGEIEIFGVGVGGGTGGGHTIDART